MKEKKLPDIRFGALLLITLLAAFSRLLPHPPNFAPIGAMALFGAAYFSKRSLALVIPVVSMWLSDLLLNNTLYSQYFEHFTWFYPGFYWTYGSFILIGFAAFLVLKKVRIQTLLPASLLASVIFFVVSNFGVWVSAGIYPYDFNGLISCYIAGLPFLKNTLLGDLVYTGVLFGAFELAHYHIPALRSQPKHV